MRTNKEALLVLKEVTISEEFYLLPQCDEISTYIKEKFGEDELTRQYYFMPLCKKNVFLVLALTLGGPNTPTQLQHLLGRQP